MYKNAVKKKTEKDKHKVKTRSQTDKVNNPNPKKVEKPTEPGKTSGQTSEKKIEKETKPKPKPKPKPEKPKPTLVETTRPQTRMQTSKTEEGALKIPKSKTATPVDVPKSKTATPVDVPKSKTVTPVDVPKSKTAMPVHLPKSKEAASTPRPATSKKIPIKAKVPAPTLVPSTIRIAKVFELGAKLGSGAFGDVFSGHDIRTGAEVAVKMEPLDAECPQLVYESRVMQELQAAPGFPRHYWFGREGNYHVLAMQRLGRCLASRYMPVELGVVQSVARDALARLHTLHAAGFAHRDIKPENFVYGVGATKAVLYIIDFGLCKRVAEPRTGRHIPHRLGKSLSGTPRYASTRMHDGEEQSRRDDIEALGYMLVYLVKGGLPWQGLPAKNDYREAGNLKKKTKLDVLCEGLPPAFAATIKYARELDFSAMPDYIFLRSLWT